MAKVSPVTMLLFNQTLVWFTTWCCLSHVRQSFGAQSVQVSK